MTIATHGRLALAMTTLLLAAPAAAADASALCEGWSGHWRAIADSTRGTDGNWAADLSDPLWQVRPLASGKCHFTMGEAEVDDFDVDMTNGFYDVTNWQDGKALPVQRYRFVASAIEGPRSWTVVVAAPHTPGATGYYRLVMTLAGDLFSMTTVAATTENGAYFPRTVTVHTRVK